MSVTIYDRIHAARDWCYIKHTFGDTEITVHHHDLKKWFTVPYNWTPIEMFDAACKARGELVTEYTTRREVTKALLA